MSDSLVETIMEARGNQPGAVVRLHAAVPSLCSQRAEAALLGLDDEISAIATEALPVLLAAGALESAADLCELGGVLAPEDLAVAAFRRLPDVVIFMLDRGVPVDAPGAHGYTALHWATENNDAPLVAILLQRGANCHAVTEEGTTPLEIACHAGFHDVLRLLLDGGADAAGARSWRTLAPRAWLAWGASRVGSFGRERYRTCIELFRRRAA
jgi:hypothetical protein